MHLNILHKIINYDFIHIEHKSQEHWFLINN